MFRQSAVLSKIFRGNMTSKRGNKNFYKGRGAPTMGRFTKAGWFMVDTYKVNQNTFLCPDLTGFPLKAYVSPLTPLVKRPADHPCGDVAAKFGLSLPGK